MHIRNHEVCGAYPRIPWTIQRWLRQDIVSHLLSSNVGHSQKKVTLDVQAMEVPKWRQDTGHLLATLLLIATEYCYFYSDAAQLNWTSPGLWSGAVAGLSSHCLRYLPSYMHLYQLMSWKVGRAAIHTWLLKLNQQNKCNRPKKTNLCVCVFFQNGQKGHHRKWL